MRYALALWLAGSLAWAQDRPPLQLTLKRAVEIATSPEGSAQVQLSGETLKQAGLRSKEARAAFLPDVESVFSYQDRTANLAAMGISLSKSPFPGFALVWRLSMLACSTTTRPALRSTRRTLPFLPLSLPAMT